uniref:Flavin-containing monooxygenase n=1 Tax=Anisakis simplex TaxID=6269 RepID=A0A0M3K845_ANISI
LYKYVFPPDNTSLAVLGLILPFGSIPPIAEMQARWVAAVWSGQVELPSPQGMMADIEQTREIRMKRYFKSTNHAIQVDYLRYMDEIAEMIGVKPNIWKVRPSKQLLKYLRRNSCAISQMRTYDKLQLFNIQFVRQMTKMRVCVIGAGESGLPAIKECLDAGFDVVAYERTSDIGGRWNHRPNFKEGGNVAKSTFSNISKEMMAYSIFTPSENCPNFMHNSVFCQYLKDYAENFDLLKDIRLNTSVEKVQRADNKWEVTTNDGKKETFEFVLICTGRYSIPKLPEIKGMEGFQGRVLHSRDFIDAEAFRNKNIFIVGIGNSALEIAVEAAAVAKSVQILFLSILLLFCHHAIAETRLWSSALPYDVALNSRFYKALYDILPWTILNDYMEHHYEDGLSHELYGLRPQHRFFQQTFTICDSLPDLACSGAIIITEGVDHVDATGVVVDGDRHFPADVIILATGYSIQFPFLYPESLIDIKENDMNLYKLIFPPEHPSLAVIGFAQPRMGGIAPIAEMQSRLAAAVFSGQVKLPAKSAMVNDINIRRSALSKR